MKSKYIMTFLVTVLFISTVIAADFSSLFIIEFFDEGDTDESFPTVNGNVLGQIFTVGNQGKDQQVIPEGFAVKMDQVTGAGVRYFWNIYTVNGSFAPNLSDGLCDLQTTDTDSNFSTAGQNFYNISLTNCQKLTPDINYSLTVWTSNGTAGNHADWRINTSGLYTGGHRVISTDNGTGWDNEFAQDHLFFIYGDQDINITLNSPGDGNRTLTGTTQFNITTNLSNNQLENITLWIDDVLNETIGLNGTTNQTIFNKSMVAGQHNWTVEVCTNASSCLFSQNRSVIASSYIANSFDFNASVNETERERFAVNVTTEGNTPTNANLVYAGTTSSATVTNIGGNDFRIESTIDIPTGEGTNEFNFTFDISGSEVTDTQTQAVGEINLALCNATVNTNYVNFTFVNETDSLEDTNATISSEWVYFLGSGTTNKTLSFANTTENPSYGFCFDPPDKSLNVNLLLAYNNDESQQRVHTLRSALFTNTTTNTVLYLLPTTLGIFTRYQTITANGDPVSDALATVTRTIGGSTITAITSLTDSSGLVIMFLNPDAIYDYVFSATGFNDNTFSLNPNSADIYLITMGGVTTTQNETEVLQGTSTIILPSNSSLKNNTDVVFSFNVTSTQTITFMSMNLTNASGHQLLFASQGNQGLIEGTMNTANNSTILGYFELRTANENVTITKRWTVGNEFEGDYSLFRQLTQFLQYDFNLFWRILIVIITIAAILLFMSFNELVDTSESKVLVTILLIWAFSFVGWLDTGIAVNSGNASLNTLSALSNKYGIAIVSSSLATWAIGRRTVLGVG